MAPLFKRSLFLIAFSLLVTGVGCKKDPPKLIPTLTTTVSNITSTTATATGNVVDDGGADITTRGFCWNTLPDPTIINQKTTDVTGASTFISTITGLIPGMLYYVRSYAVNSVGTGYGNTVTVTTPAVTATITTSALTAVSATTATCGGNILNDGGALITARGVCWDVNQNPTVLNAQSVMTDSEAISLNAKTTDGTGTGMFTSSITGLTPGSTYYFRAYATNSAGTSYGNQVVGTTNAVIPTLTTTAASNITESSFTTGGAITFDGGSTVSARGVCWSTAQNPTVADNKTNDGTGPSSFISTITGLSAGTTYNVRAYATNSMGTAYGNQITTTTLSTVPSITTSEVSPTTETTATGGGVVISDGGSPVTSRGICWNTNPNPTILNNRTINGTGNGSFPSQITGLITNTTYYVRAYATNALGTSYGEEKQVVLYLNTPGPNVTDIDGNVYHSVKIGDQIWMVENLKTTRYNNGNLIGTTTPTSLDISDESIPKYQWPSGGDESNVATYGRLYTWYAATDSRNICPSGWHVSSYSEWTTLTTFLGGESIAGAKLKEEKTVHWLSPNNYATNISGFTALPGGYRRINGTFDYLGIYGNWWNSTERNSSDAWYRTVTNVGSGAYRFSYFKSFGISVRCIKD